MLSFNECVFPGPSSQTTNVKIESLTVRDTTNLGFFDASAPIIREPQIEKWEDAAKNVLQEYADLWEKLSKL